MSIQQCYVKGIRLEYGPGRVQHPLARRHVAEQAAQQRQLVCAAELGRALPRPALASLILSALPALLALLA